MRKIVFLALIHFGIEVVAHPVSFKEGVGFMSYNSTQSNELLLTYSFSHRFASGLTYLRDSNSEFYIPRANFLIKRWNEIDSQANFYISIGAGVEKYSSQSYGVKLAELVVDWESRQYYTYFEHLHLIRHNDSNSSMPKGVYNHTKVRVGFAPFLADYNDFNVWCIVQGEKHNDQNQIEMTQFVRFYIKNVLWEVGAGFNGNWAFNFMVHM